MGLFSNFLLRAATKTQRRELDEFIENIRGFGDAEVANIVTMASVVRVGIDEIYSRKYEVPLSLLDPFGIVEHDAHIPIHLFRQLKERQKKGDGIIAVGFMVWLHTIRGTQNMTLRATCRDMWKELERGMLYLLRHGGYNAVLDIQTPSDYDAFPLGMEPR